MNRYLFSLSCSFLLFVSFQSVKADDYRYRSTPLPSHNDSLYQVQKVQYEQERLRLERDQRDLQLQLHRQEQELRRQQQEQMDIQFQMQRQEQELRRQQQEQKELQMEVQRNAERNFPNYSSGGRQRRTSISEVNLYEGGSTPWERAGRVALSRVEGVEKNRTSSFDPDAFIAEDDEPVYPTTTKRKITYLDEELKSSQASGFDPTKPYEEVDEVSISKTASTPYPYDRSRFQPKRKKGMFDDLLEDTP